ncbi:MAG: pseudouridine synthase [Saprospiraceae bacterium]|nr:pseudouridine synthase [Saprospiraceae bacterium]
MTTKKVYDYFMIYKPYGVLSQFSKENADDRTLKELYHFPSDVYPVGRLDKDSEGLLILTNDPSLNAELLRPIEKMEKVYWVQVEGNPDKSFIQKMSEGVSITIDKKKYNCLPAEVQFFKKAPPVPDRNPPIRTRLNIADRWISIKLVEGKNRQIRKMCASLGFPVLRIVRISVGKLKLSEFVPGSVTLMKRKDCV